MAAIKLNHPRRLGGGILLLLLPVFIIGGVQAAESDDPTAGAGPVLTADSASPVGECASQVHFFAEEVENNFFGPAAEGSDTELHARRCVDPSLVVAHAHDWGVPGFAQLNGDEQFAAKTRELIGNRDAWRLVVAAMELLESQSAASIEVMSGSYQTLYMLDGVTDVPLIRKASPDRPSFEVLRFVHPDGRVVNLKLDCGFQPVRQDFPGIPPVETPPPPGMPPAPPKKAPPTTVPGTVPPGTTPTTVPGTVPPGTTPTTVPPTTTPGRKSDVPTTLAPPPTTAKPQTTTTVAPPRPPATAAPDPTPPNVSVVNTTIPPRTYTPDGNSGTGSPPVTHAPPATVPAATPGNGGQVTPSR